MKCPSCHSTMIWIGDHDKDDESVTSEYLCPNCGLVDYDIKGV